MFIDALRIFSWKGRICRRQYFMAMFFFAVIAWAIARSNPSVAASMSASVVLEVFKTPTYIKRLHDMNKSGRLIFLVFILSLIPIVNIGVGLILLFSPGTQGPNEYGEDPREKWNSPSSTENRERKKNDIVSSNKGNRLLENNLTKFIVSAVESQESLKSLQEKIEMQYLLLYETFLLLRSKKQKLDNTVTHILILRMVARESCGANLELRRKFSDEYFDRASTYLFCSSMVEPSNAIKRRVFALSHFLQKARGKTTGKYVMDVIQGKREVQLEDISEFIDVFESSQLLINIVEDINAIKHIIEKFG